MHDEADASISSPLQLSGFSPNDTVCYSLPIRHCPPNQDFLPPVQRFPERRHGCLRELQRRGGLPRQARLQPAHPRPVRRRSLGGLGAPDVPRGRRAMEELRAHHAGHARGVRHRPRLRLAVLRLPPAHGPAGEAQRGPPRARGPGAEECRFPVPLAECRQ